MLSPRGYVLPDLTVGTAYPGDHLNLTVAFDVTVPGGADTEVTAILRDAVLADRAIVWPAGITEEQKKAAIADLEARGILVRKTA